ncbi:usherin-like isoform X2 [Pomacea canaliculata]|uniref:usherin-like isoform X2 n=1 Tax=Pomacea canaliculata TaxID=400727 RepID=UPI000D73EC22|nr:usherin-like isoform X2 [Pomacea canaliculata]
MGSRHHQTGAACGTRCTCHIECYDDNHHSSYHTTSTTQWRREAVQCLGGWRSGSFRLDPSADGGRCCALFPFTSYTVQVQACTSGGCTNSSGVTVRTTAAKPSGLKPIVVVETNSSAMALAWTYPSSSNGVILRFVVYRRLACPLAEQPFSQPACVPGDAQEVYRGLDTILTTSGLASYTAYEFLLQAENELGSVDLPVWVRAVTAPAAPQYVKAPVLTKNGTLAVVDWTQSFALNGRLRDYVLSADGEVVSKTISSVGGVERLTKDKTITFIIQAVTVVGQAQSPPIIFDPNAANNTGVTNPTPTASPTTDENTFYKEVWFIIVIVIVGLLIIAIIIAICFRRSYNQQPYIRERLPLEPHRPSDHVTSTSSTLEMAASSTGAWALALSTPPSPRTATCTRCRWTERPAP